MEEIIAQLESWMKAPVYFDGVVIYEKHGKSNFLKRLFSKGSDDYNFQVLHRELEALLKDLRDKKAEKDDKTPEEVKILKANAKRLMDERVILKEQARQLVANGVTEGEQLRKIAFRLAFDIKKELDRDFGRIDFYERNGFLPQIDESVKLTPEQLVKRRNTLRTYISRGKNPEKLVAWKKELELIELQLQNA